MSTYKTQKSHKLFRHITAGILSAVMFTSSVMTNYAGLNGKVSLSATGEETAGSENAGAFSVTDVATGLSYQLTFKANAQWRVTFSGSTVIPANIINAEEFKAYKDNIDEIVIGSDITGIAAHAFEGLEGLHAVIFEENEHITEIGDAAFKDCTYLASINLKNCSKLETLGCTSTQGKSGGEGVFANTALTEIAIPEWLKAIGDNCFYQCSQLSKVEFDENCQVSYFGYSSFAECTALEYINLEDCAAKSIAFNQQGQGTGAFYKCTSLETVTVPKGADGNISYLFQNATSLSSISFKTNTNSITNIQWIVYNTSVEVLDLTPLEGFTAIGDYQIRGNSITKVIVPANVTTLGIQVMGDMKSLGVVEFEENNSLKRLPTQAFYSNETTKPLMSVNLEALHALETIGSQAFEGNYSLASLTIPVTVTTIEDNAFKNCSGLINIQYNAENLTGVGSSLFDGAGIFDFTIGTGVKNIPVAFLSQIQDHIASIKFEGAVTFTVEEEGKSTGLKEPFASGGTYCADENGNLYRIDGNGAKLIYANKALENVTIPAAVGSYTVTGVAKDAFKNANVKSLTIENAGNITTLEDYAFANAMLLEKINNLIIDDEIKALFGSIDFGNNLFYNTKITNSQGNAITENIFPDGATKYPHDQLIGIYRDERLSLNYIVQNTKMEITKEEDADRAGKFWTGQVAEVGFAYTGGMPVRIYIRAGEDCEINLNGTDGQTPQPTNIEGVYYYDIVHAPEESGTDMVNLSYPNFCAPGSKVQIWAVEFDSSTAYESFKATNGAAVIYPNAGDIEGTYKVSDKYFEIEWTTKPVDFTLEKIYHSNESPGFILSSDGKATLSDLKYEIIFRKTNPQEVDRNLGSDIVRYVDYTDTLTLPDTLSWREEIGSHLADTHFIKKDKGGTLYIQIDNKEYELFTLSGIDNLVDMSIKPLDNGNYALCWRLINTSSTAEISPMDGYITFGSEVLVAKEGIAAGGTIGTIHNEVVADEYFTFSDVQRDKDDADVTNFTAPSAELKIQKEVLNDIGRMGEDVQYKITVENSSAFDYTSLGILTDDFNKDEEHAHYIKPENMELLFADENHGDRLTITITQAVLAKELTQETNVNAVNKTDKTSISAQNSADQDDQKYDGLENQSKNGTKQNDLSVAYRKVTITLRKTGDVIQLHYEGTSAVDDEIQVSQTVYIGEGKQYSDIASALDAIGYIVTVDDVYKLEWDYSNYTFKGGESMEFMINASIKDSLMYLSEEDYDFWIDYSKNIELSLYNYTNFSNTNSDNLEARTKTQIVQRDLEIRKTGAVDGEQLNGNYVLQDGIAIDYSVKVIHYGSGSYEVLPVVDHMSGLQAVIVRVDKNVNAEWASHADKTTIDGVEYYVLNHEYTYKGVYTSEYYADSIKVEKTDNGLDTLIKYYIVNTAGRDFELEVTYKAICSQEYAGNSNTKAQYRVDNEAWLNDRPGHRIHDALGVSGSAVNFDKKILITANSEDPQSEELADSLSIKQSTKVTYRLMLNNTTSMKTDDEGNIIDIGTTLTLNGDDIFDMLPLTSGTFTWSKSNISDITYRIGEAGYGEDGNGGFERNAFGYFTYNGIKLEGESDGREWRITSDSPSSIITSTNSDQQYIVWDENFTVTLPPQATVYMYVTLTFPIDDTEWNNFLNKTGAQDLVNTFYVYNQPSSVKHTLVDTVKALLQKGVYETGTYIRDNDGNLTSQYSSVDRFHYANNSSDESRIVNTVTYYVVIRNSGNTRLYLAPIYDILPPGFTYMGLRTINGSSANSTSPYNVGNADTDTSSKEAPTQYGGRQGIIAKPVGDGDLTDFNYWDMRCIDTMVKYSYYGDNVSHTIATADGECQILKFEFENMGDHAGLTQDSANGKYYLEPGQYLQFGYTVYTGNAQITEALNTVAMQFYDPNNTGAQAELDDETDILVSNVRNTAPNNDGDRYLWGNDEANEFGFTDVIGDKSNPDWFVSDVTVTREKISPGIKKVVDDPMIKAGDRVNWTITSYNNSTSSISGYTITDTLEAPLKFEGDFSYYLYAPSSMMSGVTDTDENDNENYKWYTRADYYFDGQIHALFRITRSGSDIKIYSNESLNSGSRGNLKDGNPVTFTVSTVCRTNMYANNSTYLEKNRTEITVQLVQNKNAAGKVVSETLTITFEDPRWDIIANGYSVLKFSTPSTNDIDPGTYTNTAMFSPKDNTYGDQITQGRLVKDTDGNNIGVDHSAVVSIYTGTLSGSVKMIEQKTDPTNFTTSERDDNYIRLLDKKDIFTYTLEVCNLDENTDMENLVIIDNLPEHDDATTLREESLRESDFKVSLANNPNVEVRLYSDYNKIAANRNKISPYYYEKGTDYELLTAGTDYIVEYSDKNSKFDEDDWQRKDEGTGIWYGEDSISKETRSIRITFLTNITAGQAIQVRFDAVIDDSKAVPGQIAWNTFGYSYKSGNLYPKASPAKVGICIPGVPTLSKKVVDANDNEVNVSEDTTFEFIIYEGDTAVDFEDYKAETVAAALNNVNRKFMYAALTVPAGQSESKMLALENFLKFDYTDDDRFKQFDEQQESTFWNTESTYYVVELETGDEYKYKSTNREDKNNYNFKIDPIYNTPLSFVNEKITWEIKLTKTDENLEPLAGALFGLYTSNESKKMKEADFQELGIDDSYKTRKMGETYYLAYAATSSDDGVIEWKKLDEEVYVLIELEAPEGYNRDSTILRISRDMAKNGVYTRTVKNIKIQTSFDLPETGGIGVRLFEVSGLLLTCFAAVFLGLRYKRRRA